MNEYAPPLFDASTPAGLEQLVSGIVDKLAERLGPTRITESMTFGELYARYSELHVGVRCSKSERKNSYYFYKKHRARWEDVQVHTIARRDVQEWVRGLSAQSPSSAVRAVNIMQAVINWGVKWELIPDIQNPCKGVERPRLKARDRFVRPAELVKLNAALQVESPLMRDFFWMCLHTGGRKGNVLSMRWDEIDFDLKIWTIPHEKFKNGDTHIVPLVEAAISILCHRQAVDGGSPWVFPGKTTSGHLMEPKRAWDRVLKRAGLTNLTIHDLRRTLGSYMAISGANVFSIAGMLGHKDMRSTKVYARLDVASVRRAVEVVSERMQETLALPMPVSPIPLAITAGAKTKGGSAEKQYKNANARLTATEQIILEAKILSALRAVGRNTKSSFYKTVGSQIQLNSREMERVLTEMAERGLIDSFQDDLGNWRYMLVKEAS